jgi:DNA-binding winged helix-turn-helix (wHTH) protein/Flp pilus assembly protein TadD
VKTDAQSAPADPGVHLFGGFRLDLRRRILFSPSGEAIALTPRVLDTLVCMVQRPGVLLDRDTLMDSIWPDTAVEPNNLSQNIARLRRVFEETPGENRFIETVPGRGYRFIAEVRTSGAPGDAPDTAGTPPLVNVEACQLYRQALRLLQRPTPANCQTAIEQLEAALALEASSAPAWAWLADAHLLSVNAGHAGPERLEDADRHARRALDIVSDTAVAHIVIATVHAHRGEWLASESHFMTAISLDEADAMARSLYSSFLLQQVGHTQRSLAELHVAFGLLPDDPRMLMNLAMANCVAGRDDEALRCARLAVGFGYPETAIPLPLVFMHTAARAGRYAEAQAQASLLLGSDRWGREAVACVYAALENPALRAQAVSALCELLDRSFEGLIRTSGLMLVLAQWLTQLGRLDLAFDAVHQALDACARRGVRPPNWQALWIPELLPFRADERFQAVAARLGLPQYWSAFGPPDR